MGMPLDLYVIRHGESEANVIINAGEQGDNSLYTQDNVTVATHRHRAQAGRLHRPLARRATAAVRPVSGLAIRTHARNRRDDGAAESQVGGDARATRTLLG